MMDKDRIAEIKTRFESLSTGKQQRFIRYLEYLESVDNPSAGGRK